MRRVIVAAWGPDATKYAGRRVTLFCDTTVQFGGEAVGGTRISHMSGIDKPLRVPLLVKRGKSATFTVQPLPDAAPTPATVPAEVIATTAKALKDGNIGDYLAYIKDNGAPQHIVDYVTAALNLSEQEEVVA